jgi:hypothetical protein
MKPYFYVYRYDNDKAPRFRHDTIEQAETEAKRLAGTSPGATFEILMVVGTTSATKPQTFWMDGVHPPESAPSECGSNTDNVSKYHRPAIVTRYPTGCFGIEYNGSMFHWWGFEESGVHAELERLHLHPCMVKWQERYYDRRYPLSDPRSYALREFMPNAATGP